MVATELSGALVILLMPDTGENKSVYVPRLQRLGAKEIVYESNGIGATASLWPPIESRSEKFKEEYTRVVILTPSLVGKGRSDYAKDGMRLYARARHTQNLFLEKQKGGGGKPATSKSLFNTGAARPAQSALATATRATQGGGGRPGPTIDLDEILRGHFRFSKDDPIVVKSTWLAMVVTRNDFTLRFDDRHVPGPYVISKEWTPAPVPATATAPLPAPSARPAVPARPAATATDQAESGRRDGDYESERAATGLEAGPSPGRGGGPDSGQGRKYEFGPGPDADFLRRKKDGVLLPLAPWYRKAAWTLTSLDGGERRVENCDPRIERGSVAIFCPRCNLWKGEWAFCEENLVKGSQLSMRGDHYMKTCLACYGNLDRISELGVVYKLFNIQDGPETRHRAGGIFYVGSTNKDVHSRLTTHLISSFNTELKSTIYEYMRAKRAEGYSDAYWKMTILQDKIPINYLTIVEQAWIEHLKPGLNLQRASKRDIADLVDKEIGRDGTVRFEVDPLKFEKLGSPDGAAKRQRVKD